MGKDSENRTPLKLVRRENPALSRDEQRYRKKKARQRRLVLKKIFVSLFTLCVVAALGVLLAFTVFFKIETIKVEGTKIYSSKMVAEQCGVKPGDNLLRVNSEEVADNLIKNLPYIGTVSVKRNLPGTLTLILTDTRETAAVSKDGAFVLIDSTGRILDTDSALLRDNVALVTGIETVAPEVGKTIETKEKAAAAALLEILESADASKLNELTAIDLTDLSNITAEYDDRIKLKIGNTSSLDKKIARAAAAIAKENAKETGSLDLSVEPYAYFRKTSDDDKAATKS